MQTTFVERVSVILCLVTSGVIAKKSECVRSSIVENEVFEKTHVITVKSPNIELPVDSAGKHPILSRRRVNTVVDPVDENCLTDTFKSELNQLRRKIQCEPRDTVVDLIPPFGAMLTPNAVVVKRCGGMCHGLKRCLSAEKKDTKFYVKTIKDKQMYCSSIIVSEDTKCKCGCLQNAGDCNANQIYNKSKCACICKNEKDYLTCAEHPNENFQWDPTTCSCICQQSKSCTTGTNWNERECRCVKLLP